MVAGFLARVGRRIAATRSSRDDVAPPVADATQAPLLTRAVELHRGGHFQEARAAYLAILAADERNAVACCMLGTLAHQQGDAEAAVEWMTRALDLEPRYVLACSNLGLVYLSLGRLEQAEGQLRKALAIDPAFDNAHALLALVLRERGDLAGAEDALMRALSLNPSNADARNNLGNLCKDAGRLDDAEAHYREALTIRPGGATIWKNLGAVAIARGDWVAAASSFHAAIEAESEAADAWSSLGYALGRAGRLADAEAACRRALALRPDWPDALVNLASVLKDQHDLAAAEVQCRRAIALDPGHAGAWTQLGIIRQAQDDAIDAELCFSRAIGFDPSFATARYNLGAMNLLQGRYKDGFTLLESRFQAFPQDYSSGKRAELMSDVRRRWNGEPLAGRRLLVWSEQGFGDTLMMLRFLPLLPGLGAGRVTLLCERELRRIAVSIPGVDAVLVPDDGEQLPEFDVHCPTMSLPFCCRFDGSSSPVPVPYITVSPDAKDTWTGRLPKRDGFRVGVAWAGNPMLRDDALRSVPLAELAPLSRLDGVQWISLQKGAAVDQIVCWEAPILDSMNDCRDFADTAALVSRLDLVIAVDTAVVHLAGAMGKRVWLLNRAGSEWRWGLTGTTSPWYPSLRIFRQRHALDWRPVIREIAAELELLVAGVPCSPEDSP